MLDFSTFPFLEIYFLTLLILICGQLYYINMEEEYYVHPSWYGKKRSSM